MDRLEMNEVYKSFGGVHALKGVNLDIRSGEVHGLIGENGAGKSTLMKVLAGAIKKDSGIIKVNGQTYEFESPKDAINCGVSVIYQELNMAPHLCVAENIFLGNYPGKNGRVNWKEMYRHSNELLGRLGADISPKSIVKNLSVAQQQMVEIARAIKNKSSILVFDEPSAVLGKKDSEVLFSLIKKLKKEGVSIIYISHRLDEILRITDRVTILRDGSYITTRETKDLEMKDLISYMTGRSYNEMWPKREAQNIDSPVALEVKNICRANVLKNISFNIKKGEVLGLAGLVGSGRSEIARCIFGIDPTDSGEMEIYGKKVKVKSPSDAMKYGIGFVMEDRKNLGLLLERPISENITITNLKKYSKALWINSKSELSEVMKSREKLGIKTANVKNSVKSLSGGNQQKVVLAKWLHIEPEILILDEPTRGVDVGAKAEIYQIIENLKRQGKAILLISSEFGEVMGLSDRIVVIRRGEVAGEFTREEAARDTRILEALADGGNNNA